MSMTSLPSRWLANRWSSSRSRGGAVVDQGVGRVDAELRLRRTRRGTAPQPGELLAGEVLPARLGGGRLPLALGLGEDVRRVAALVGVDRAVVHLPRRLADRVEEPPVVGHHDQRARQGDEVSGQPGHGLDVEVVGRLVEHDQVVPRQQQGGERAAAPLATGQADDRAVEGHPGEQLLDDLPRGGVGGPLVVLPPTEHRLADGVGVDELVALVEVADLDAAGAGDAAGVRLLDARHHLEQGGLAVAVAAHDADALAQRDAERDVVEEGPYAVGLRDALEVDQVRHVRAILSGAPQRRRIGVRPLPGGA